MQTGFLCHVQTQRLLLSKKFQWFPNFSTKSFNAAFCVRAWSVLCPLPLWFCCFLQRICGVSWPRRPNFPTNGKKVHLFLLKLLSNCVAGGWKCHAIAQLIRSPANRTVMIGKNTTLTCSVGGNPLPVLTWLAPAGASYRIGRWHCVDPEAGSSSESCEMHWQISVTQNARSAHSRNVRPPALSLKKLRKSIKMPIKSVLEASARSC